jgi:hypothetical protein
MNNAVTLTLDAKKWKPLANAVDRITDIIPATIWDTLNNLWMDNKVTQKLTKWFTDKGWMKKSLPATSIKLWVKEIKAKMDQKKLMNDMWKLIKQNWIDPTWLTFQQMEDLLSNFK